MSSKVQGAADARLDADHGQRRDRAAARWLRIRAISTYAELVRQREPANPGNPPSLGNCEKVPTSDFEQAQNHPEEYEYVDHSSPERTVLLEAKSRSRERQEVALELVQADETPHARRFINCLRKSAQLECPPMAGGCGSDDNYVPITCDSRLCPECGKRRQGQVASQYGPIVASWEYPSMWGVGLPKRIEPDAEAVDRAISALRGAFGSLRRRVVPPDGPGWSWEAPPGADERGWKRSLQMVGERDLARYWEMKYVDQGKGIPFDEVMDRGFYAVDVKQQHDACPDCGAFLDVAMDEDGRPAVASFYCPECGASGGADELEGGRLNVHLHIIGDCPWMPQAALSHLWDELLAAPVVDVRRVGGRGSKDAEKAALEVAGYAAKAPQYDSAEAKVEYLKAVKGSKLVQPFGELHGNTPVAEGRLCCSNCERAPGYWNYVDVVDGAYDNMRPDWTVDGDRPPPPGVERSRQ